MADEPEPGDRTSRPFTLYAVAQSVSSTGTWMQRLGIGWLAWDLTQSTSWVGAMALTEIVAALWVAPLAGVITDRSNAFRVNLLFQCCGIAVSLLLYAVTATGNMTIWLLWLLALADTTWQGLSQPARMVSVGLLAGRKNMARAIAASSIGFNVARAAGPALAGLIIVNGGPALAFLCAAGTFMAMIAALLHLRTYLDRPGAATGADILQDIVGGYRYIARTPAVATIFLLALAFSVFGRPFTELFPAIAGEMFGGGPTILSMLMSAQGVGALLGGAWMLRRRSLPALVRLTCLTGLGMAGIIIAFSLVGGANLALALIAAAGLCHVMCNIGMQSLAQLSSDISFRGRTMALYGLIFRTGPAASAAVIGAAAEWLGLQLLLGTAAGLCVAAFLLIMTRRHGTLVARTSGAPPL
ncbi:MFS transporter [Ancylobacter oerskovii]|uniref:MFS transporter n=1 Tax=Ancylobacter oerskovii TaxID=459519 RepID=A0ABW4YZL9_9HYPH|nr:MFS transporter [Ancylobacter oerskovii]MBS7543873.1 MFS transporter [Ancylobacter oerskovii]